MTVLFVFRQRVPLPAGRIWVDPHGRGIWRRSEGGGSAITMRSRCAVEPRSQREAERMALHCIRVVVVHDYDGAELEDGDLLALPDTWARRNRALRLFDHGLSLSNAARAVGLGGEVVVEALRDRRRYPRCWRDAERRRTPEGERR